VAEQIIEAPPDRPPAAGPVSPALRVELARAETEVLKARLEEEESL
jgi:hypothetical protein